MKSRPYLLWLVVISLPLWVLAPLVETGTEWREMARLVPDAPLQAYTRASDWVVWQTIEGQATAQYVFPRGPGDRAGIHTGDQFYALSGEVFLNPDDVSPGISTLPPGSKVRYSLLRDSQPLDVEVILSRHPTFLYPFSTALWLFALIGFLLGGILHVVGLMVAAPLTRASARGRLSFSLVAVSSLWTLGHLARISMVALFGPPGAQGLYAVLFQALTALSLLGWVGFPAVLVESVLERTGLRVRLFFRLTFALRLLPAVLLGGLALWSLWRGSFGPFTPDALVRPILLYASLSTALAAFLTRFEVPRTDPASRKLSALLALLSFAAFLGMWLLVPEVDAMASPVAGWLIVATQLLTAAPVSLVALSTLRFGNVTAVLSRSALYGLIYGLATLILLLLLFALEPLLVRTEASYPVMSALLALVTFGLAHGFVHWFSEHRPSLLEPSRHRVRELERALQDKLPTLLDPDALARETVRTAGEAMDSRSAVLFFRISGVWHSAAYHPEPPYLTSDHVSQVWPFLSGARKVWSRDRELSEQALPPDAERALIEVGATVVVPIVGETQPVGVLVLAPKRERRAIYHVDDLNVLRSLTSQFGLALERLYLIERERVLARQSAEAQLVALRAQINPHFLFNALNTIAAFVGERPDDAEHVVEHLAAIFRHTLNTASALHVPLGAEMDLVRHYLAVEKARFGDKLDVYFEIEPSLRAAPIPAFSVQTLVENAVKHGITPKRTGGRIEIVARKHEGDILVTVFDTGVGLPQAPESAPTAFFGIGLRNVSSRLMHLYARTDLLTFGPGPSGGSRFVLRLPPLPV